MIRENKADFKVYSIIFLYEQVCKNLWHMLRTAIFTMESIEC